MRVLVIGSGGREHAIVWKLAQSEKVSKIFAAPGNDGMKSCAECVPILPNDFDRLIQFVKENQIELTVVGPEEPLIKGIVNRFESEGLRIFGPHQEAAQIEGSKRFAKELMHKYQIPTARFRSFNNSAAAKAYVHQQGAPIVVKANGLAGGKGVVVAQTVQEAELAIEEAMDKRIFGDAGNEVVIEEFLEGQEISLMAFVDESAILPMVVAQDHKPVFDGDQGPNTGGMGTYSPVPQIPQEVIDQAIYHILKPIHQAFIQENLRYRGVLFAGLMVTQEGPKVIEFNARFGDPETQVVLPRLETDLLDVMLATTEGKLHAQTLRWVDQAAVCVILSSNGYPGSYINGIEIVGLENIKEDGVYVFHAGTKQQGEKWVTAGGRVLGITALGRDVEQARKRVYHNVKEIHFDGMHYRSDIAAKSLKGIVQIEG